jgi:sarcosine oxidase subunit alpha
MSFLLNCPNCGPRDVAEFRYGGQILPEPPSPLPLFPSEGERGRGEGAGANLPEVQHERWYHRHGCRRWLSARRDVRTNEVVETGWLGEGAS